MPAIRPLADYVRVEQTREAVRQRYAEQDRRPGVAWSGMGADPRAALTDAQIEARAIAQRAHDIAFRETPQSRYLAALSAMAAAAEAARACYSRGLSTNMEHAWRALEEAAGALNEATKALGDVGATK